MARPLYPPSLTEGARTVARILETAYYDVLIFPSFVLCRKDSKSRHGRGTHRSNSIVIVVQSYRFLPSLYNTLFITIFQELCSNLSVSGIGRTMAGKREAAYRGATALSSGLI